eukprot:CAMPEP_0179314362 /NCGR_PEP_ID=MMETSP0797-20121207/54403_1 /TAXON_ID=47934 /ORGANISM="Dinophysis acuminata, Strain DAEP01" /LENGTH=53 /DNA_ID=CAMNT_0021024645 /DNA_START=80 /DNA_END=241 /DNA_ORIENTATION=-
MPGESMVSVSALAAAAVTGVGMILFPASAAVSGPLALLAALVSRLDELEHPLP